MKITNKEKTPKPGLKVMLVIIDDANCLPYIIKDKILEETPDFYAEVDGPYVDLDLLYRERMAALAISDDMLIDVHEACPPAVSGDEDVSVGAECYDKYLSLIYDALEKHKLPYNKLCEITLENNETRSYIGLIFEVESIGSIYYGA